MLSQHESLSNVGSSLGSESSGLLSVGNTFDFSVSLLDNLEGNDSKIGSANASSAGLSLSLSRASGSVKRDSYIIIALLIFDSRNDYQLLLNRKALEKHAKRAQARLAKDTYFLS